MATTAGQRGAHTKAVPAMAAVRVRVAWPAMAAVRVRAAWPATVVRRAMRTGTQRTAAMQAALPERKPIRVGLPAALARVKKRAAARVRGELRRRVKSAELAEERPAGTAEPR